MSKRSVDKGDGGKGTPARAREAGAAEVSSIPTERKARAKAEARGPAGIWQNSELYWYAGLVLAALFSFYLRAIVPWKSVFVGDSVIFSSESDAWYHMILAKGTVINLQRLWFDPMTYFPHGTPLHFGPFVSWIITIFSYIFGLGHPSMHLVEVVGAFLPAVEGALLVFPVYFIGKELGGKSCGLISALMVAVLPGQLFSRTVLGFTDHHASEVLLSTTAVMFFLLAMRHGRGMTFAGVLKSWSSSRRPLLYAVLAGVFLGLYIDAWASGFLFEGMILLFIFLQSIVDHVKGRRVDYLGISGAITFFVATLIILPFVKPYYGFNHYLYSLFQPTILLLGVVTVLLFAFLSNFLRERGYSSFYYPGALALIMVAGTMVLSLAAPQFTSPLFTGLNIFSPKTGGAATVGEAAPLLFYQGELSFSTMLSNFPGMGNIIVLSTFFLAILGMVLVLGRYVKSQRPVDLLLLTWSVMLLAMTLAQNRFAYYYEVNVALLTGYLIVSILSLADLKSDEKIDARHIATGMLLPLLLMLIISANPGLLLSSTLAILIMALVIQPVIWIGYC
jgi:dolichyl-diphosphooligosaccharide--protein glycosyltransferase